MAAMNKLRILITGFGPFPGAPWNPTQPLVERLVKLRRPAFADVELSGHIFPVTYSAVDGQLSELLVSKRPDALLMFGLAGRTRHVRIETRARNVISTRWPAADGSYEDSNVIAKAHDALTFGPHTRMLLRRACMTGIDARLSRNAGSYLCNYLSWRGIEATQQPKGPRASAFVHVPLVPRPNVYRRMGARGITLEDLVDAGEAMLMEMVKAARRG